MLTFVVVAVGCLMFPIIIPGVIGFAIADLFGAIIAYVLIGAVIVVGSFFSKD